MLCSLSQMPGLDTRGMGDRIITVLPHCGQHLPDFNHIISPSRKRYENVTNGKPSLIFVEDVFFHLLWTTLPYRLLKFFQFSTASDSQVITIWYSGFISVLPLKLSEYYLRRGVLTGPVAKCPSLIPQA